MPRTDLTVTQGDREIRFELPQPRHAPAAALWDALPRLPSWLPAGRDEEKTQFLLAITAAANRMPADVTKASLAKAAFNCAALGLLPDTVHGYCHFVPLKKDKGKPSERREVELWLGYRGYLELAFESGFLSGLTTEVVLTWNWRNQGDEPEECRRWNDSSGSHIHHEIPLDRPDEGVIKIGQVHAAYAIYTTRGGFSDVELVSGRTLRALASRQRNVWQEHPLAMCRKTPIRRAAKRWKISGEGGQRLAGALMLDDMAEASKTQPQLVSPTASDVPISRDELAGERIDLSRLGDEPTPEELAELEEQE